MRRRKSSLSNESTELRNNHLFLNHYVMQTALSVSHFFFAGINTMHYFRNACIYIYIYIYIYILGFVINNFCFVKASRNYTCKISNVLNPTGNYPINERLHRSFLFQLWKSVHYNLISDITTLKCTNWKRKFDM